MRYSIVTEAPKKGENKWSAILTIKGDQQHKFTAYGKTQLAAMTSVIRVALDAIDG
jgi:hypothetical protein